MIARDGTTVQFLYFELIWQTNSQCTTLYRELSVSYSSGSCARDESTAGTKVTRRKENQISSIQKEIKEGNIRVYFIIRSLF